MSGIELRDDTLVVDREPNELDELGFRSWPFSRCDIEHVYRLSRPSAAGLDPEAVHLATQKSAEDAVPLYTLFEDTLSESHLETWVIRLGVENEYERRKHT